jgi:phosphatidylglycerol:prolipoprotein diacylglycerol transferase
MIDRSYLHQIDPFAFQITESFGLRWYGLSYIAGFVVAWILVRWISNKKLSPIPPSRVGDLIFSGILGVLIGGRVGYCIFYNPTLLYSVSSEFPWWGLLAIQDGGMSSHGGIFGVLIALVVWGKRNNTTTLHLFDVAALCATPGLFFGRIANFINGELWGKPLPKELQQEPPVWSVKYPTEITDVWLQNPDKFSDKLELLEPLRSNITGGTTFYNTLVQELYAGNTHAIEVVQPILTAWYPSQLLQAAAEGPLLFVALCAVWWKPKNGGVLASVFLLLYGSARILTEMFRQPDDGVSLIAGLSRGQVLSVVMVVVGLLFLLYTTQRKTQKYGGFSTVINNAT